MAVDFLQIKIGNEYTRPQLAALWGYNGYQAISRGIVTPKDGPYIILFITNEKQASYFQYRDELEKGILKCEGATDHTADDRLTNARKSGDEIHLFYREKHHSAFVYHGRLRLIEHEIRSDRPSRFVFSAYESLQAAEASMETEMATHGIQDSDFMPDEEGRRRVGRNVYYERSARNRAEAIRIHGTVCAACGFNFNEAYGAEYAKDYIEVHHVRSITEQGGRPIDPAKDLIPLCSNCHSMAHRKRGKILSLEELKRLLNPENLDFRKISTQNTD